MSRLLCLVQHFSKIYFITINVLGIRLRQKSLLHQFQYLYSKSKCHILCRDQRPFKIYSKRIDVPGIRPRSKVAWLSAMSGFTTPQLDLYIYETSINMANVLCSSSLGSKSCQQFNVCIQKREILFNVCSRSPSKSSAKQTHVLSTSPRSKGHKIDCNIHIRNSGTPF